MSNTISQAFLPKTYSYNLEGQRVVVTLEENLLNIPPKTLFSLAARKNLKRGFLFVSNVLGKHVPVDPYVPLLAGAALSLQLYKKIFGYDHLDTQEVIKALISQQNTKKVYETLIQRSLVALPQKTLFIGFAETATALGHAVFSLFDNACYIHTTREQIPAMHSELNFEETHSHAVSHRCYPLDAHLVETSETIVLIDDEVTTGNTALNIIREINSKSPKSEFFLVSLLDWRTEDHRANFAKLEQELSTKIHTISLLEGKITVNGTAFCEQIAQSGGLVETELSEQKRILPEFNFLNIQDVIPACSVDLNGQLNKVQYVRLTGRFGLSSKENLQTLPLAKEIGKELKSSRIGEKTLCLGTGEFMYFPMLISAYMGEGVRFHSTTRSPIFPFEKPQYGIQNGFMFLSPDDLSIPNFVYNVPLRHYDEVYIFLERDVCRDRLIPLLNTISEIDIGRVVLVIASSC